jgi:hypothetical protein
MWFGGYDLFNLNTRYSDTYDIQSRLPWSYFESTYRARMDAYVQQAGGGAYCQRVVIHAHHFTSEQGRPAAGPPLEMGESMPKIAGTKQLATHFYRAVECTGLNISLLAVPATCTSVFHAFDATMYAMNFTRRVSGKRKVPSSAMGLLRACINWLLDDNNIRLSMNVTTSGNSNFTDTPTTVLDAFCKGIVQADHSAAVSVGQGSSAAQRFMMYKKYIARLSMADEWDLYNFAEKMCPKLNVVFVKVLCELYCDSIVVIDFVRRCLRTYRSHQNVDPLQDCRRHPASNMFMYRVDLPEGEYFYGLIDNDRTMKLKTERKLETK